MDRDESEELAHLRDEAARADRAVRRAEREMESTEQALERRLKEFEHDEEEAERHIRERMRKAQPGFEQHHKP